MQSVYLDTAIAVFFVFLLFSVIGYVIQEWWANARELRARLLEYAIHEILNDRLNKSFGVLLYEHPQIDLLKRTQKDLPSYIPSSHFAIALIDIIGRECVKIHYVTDPDTGLLKEQSHDIEKDPFKRFVLAVDNLHYSELKILLQSFLQNSNDYNGLQKAIEAWFNQYMDRVSGWYERDTRTSLRLIAAILVVVFNIDAIYLVQNVFKNSEMRNNLVAGAVQMVNDPASFNAVMGESLHSQLIYVDSVYKVKMDAAYADSASSSSIALLQKEWVSQRGIIADAINKERESQTSEWIKKINSFQLPIGWNYSDSTDIPQIEKIKKKYPYSGLNTVTNFFRRQKAYFEYNQNKGLFPGLSKRTFLSVFAGWVIAATCISFGAPFWFSVLSKLVRIRGNGVNPSEKKTEKNT